MDKKIKIEIWIYHRVVDTYESDDIKDVLKWFKKHWGICFDNGGCCFEVFDGEKRMTFEELYEAGFHD
jgi:hypothetical protein